MYEKYNLLSLYPIEGIRPIGVRWDFINACSLFRKSRSSTFSALLVLRRGDVVLLQRKPFLPPAVVSLVCNNI